MSHSESQQVATEPTALTAPTAPTAPTATRIPTQAEYEKREFALFQDQISRANSGTFHDRKTAAEHFKTALIFDPALVIERIGWLLDGNYGFGSYAKANENLLRPRVDIHAWLITTIAALEWMSPLGMSKKIWNALNKRDHAQLVKSIDVLIKEHCQAQAEGHANFGERTK